MLTQRNWTQEVASKNLMFKITCMKNIIYFGMVVLIYACSAQSPTVKDNHKTKLKNNQSFEITEISTDPTYGFSEKNPIQVGGIDTQEGPLNERRFLNALAGPNGEEISYYRAGSCCPIKSKNDPFGMGRVLLDNYRVTWKGSQDTVSIYINIYDYAPLKAPVGFTISEK